MPRGGRRRQREAESEEDESDTSSVYSMGSTAPSEGSEVVEVQDVASVFSAHMEALEHKRASTRQAGLTNMRSTLLRFDCSDVLERWSETLEDALLKSVKKGARTEALLSLQVLGAVFCSSEIESRRLDTLLPALRVAVRSHRELHVRAEAARVLALATLVAAEEPDVQNETMQLLSGAFAGAAPELAAAAASAWGLLVTDVPPCALARETVAARALFRLLDSDNMQARVAAGEVLSLLHAKNVVGEEDGDAGIVLGAGSELTQRLRALAREGDRAMSKVDRAAQRSVFRQVLHSVEEGVEPEVVLQLHGRKESVSGWNNVLRLSALRAWLGEGLQFHATFNAVSRRLLGLGEPLQSPPARRAAGDKRAMLYASAVEGKARAQFRGKKRDERKLTGVDVEDC